MSHLRLVGFEAEQTPLQSALLRDSDALAVERLERAEAELASAVRGVYNTVVRPHLAAAIADHGWAEVLHRIQQLGLASWSTGSLTRSIERCRRLIERLAHYGALDMQGALADAVRASAASAFAFRSHANLVRW